MLMMQVAREADTAHGLHKYSALTLLLRRVKPKQDAIVSEPQCARDIISLDSTTRHADHIIESNTSNTSSLIESSRQGHSELACVFAISRWWTARELGCCVRVIRSTPFCIAQGIGLCVERAIATTSSQDDTESTRWRLSRRTSSRAQERGVEASRLRLIVARWHCRNADMSSLMPRLVYSFTFSVQVFVVFNRIEATISRVQVHRAATLFSKFLSPFDRVWRHALGLATSQSRWFNRRGIHCVHIPRCWGGRDIAYTRYRVFARGSAPYQRGLFLLRKSKRGITRGAA